MNRMEIEDTLIIDLERILFEYYGDGSKSGGCHPERLFTCVEMALHSIPDVMDKIIDVNKLKLERALVSLGRMDLKDCRYFK